MEKTSVKVGPTYGIPASRRPIKAQVVFRAVVTLVAALALSSCSNSPVKTASQVPWLDLAPSQTTTTTTTTTTLAPAPNCLARQLRASTGRSGVGLSNEVAVIVLINVGSTCRLSGYPDLVGRTSVRPMGLISVHKNGTYFGNLIPVDLSTGQRGKFLLGTDVACNALNEPTQVLNVAHARADTYHSVTIVLPNGEGSLVVPRITLDVACGLDESELGVEAPTPSQYSAPPGSPQSLEASVTMPKSVRSGTTLRYIISLHNPDERTVAWTSCPNYTEDLLVTPQKAGARPVSHTYQLNCAQAKSVRPKHTVTFVMELPIKKTGSSSEAKFLWQLDTGNGPYAGRAELVTAGK